MNTDLIDIKIRAVEGGVTAAAGFKAAGIHAGFRKNPERLDYAPACLRPTAFVRRPCR